MSRRTKALAASFDFAVEMIKSRIDGEQKFIPDSPYEMTGDDLKQYLAFAYREGMKYGSNISPSARGGQPSSEPGRNPRANSSAGEAEQKPKPGEKRIGGNAAQTLRKLNSDGQKYPRPLKDP